MRTLVHLSDLHFGRVDRGVADALSNLLRRLNPHVVAVSGDFTQRARRSQFKQARAFLDSLPRPQIVVPGNHDIPLFNLFARALSPLGGYTRHITADLQPVHIDAELAVLGMNTTQPKSHKGGAVSYDDLQRVCGVLGGLGDEVVKVVVGHHPFDDPTAVEKMVKAGADVFLTGHLHVTYAGHTAERYDVGGRSAIVVEAGTATSTRMRGEANAFNLLTINRDQVVVESYGWQPPQQTFAVGDVTRFERSSSGWSTSNRS
jgi:3',5'-cyclic AMP phosphodiesterase CpdA